MKFRHVLTVAMLASGLLAAAHPATASPGKATATPAHSGVVLVVGATGRSGPAMLAALKQEG
ncbi:MAG TPA: hypothetical protein P5528_01025, partial [Steroidobacteraceae bacterium]|nr:hypothetical protein [Steroidobacteraceae bacterium]